MLQFQGSMTVLIRLFLFAGISMILGCEQSGPPSTHTSSSTLATLAERQAFFERYVQFRRNYETLDFDLTYQNNGAGMVPGPSDWDYRIVTRFPEAELHQWIPAGTSGRYEMAVNGADDT